MLSFSTQTKNEVSKLSIEEGCCIKAELVSIIQMRGSIKISKNNSIKLEISSENASVTRRIFNMIKSLYNVQSEIVVKKNIQLRKRNTYVVTIKENDKIKKILEEAGIINFSNNGLEKTEKRVDKEIVKKRCCKRAYIRGAFLGSGSFSNPEKMYHFELILSEEKYSEDLVEIINYFGLNSKIIKRRDNYIIYLKESEQIGDILNIIGAHNSLLKFEEIRVIKEMRNNVNRMVNCETANLSKTIDASVRQIKKIKQIEKEVGLEKLPKNLYEIAILRLKNQHANLKELGEMLNPVVGKSGVNYRLRKLEKIADDLEERREVNVKREHKN